MPTRVTDADMKVPERYVVLLYSRILQLTEVNETRQQLFFYGNRKLESIPPSHEALCQHVNRAVYQAGHIWGQALKNNPSLPSTSEWGWKLYNEGK